MKIRKHQQSSTELTKLNTPASGSYSFDQRFQSSLSGASEFACWVETASVPNTLSHRIARITSRQQRQVRGGRGVFGRSKSYVLLVHCRKIE